MASLGEYKMNLAQANKKDSPMERIRKWGLVGSGLLFVIGMFGFPAATEAALGDVGIIDPLYKETRDWVNRKKQEIKNIFTYSGRNTQSYGSLPVTS